MYILTDYINYDNINIIFKHSAIILSIIYRGLIMSLSFLKLIALISMTIDHITRILPAQTILMNLFGMGRPESAALLRAVQPLGRVAYPLFAFCVAQGCLHTSNKKRYMGYAALGDPSYIFLWLNPNNNSFLNLYTLNWLASLLSLVCIGLYNNSRGIRLKWLFYLYYPLHLLLLFFLRRSIYPS